jgi:hypothetical protein
MRRHPFVAVMVYSAMLGVQPTSMAQDNLAPRLTALASVIRSGDKTCRSIELRSHANGLNSPLLDSHIVLHVMYRESDKYSMCVF